MSWLTDPKIFNYIIMTLYFINGIRWWWAGSYADMSYWFGALWITASVTFGYSH